MVEENQVTQIATMLQEAFNTRDTAKAAEALQLLDQYDVQIQLNLLPQGGYYGNNLQYSQQSTMPAYSAQGAWGGYQQAAGQYTPQVNPNMQTYQPAGGQYTPQVNPNMQTYHPAAQENEDAYLWDPAAQRHYNRYTGQYY